MEQTASAHPNKMIKASLLIAVSAALYGFLGYLGTMVMQENISINTMLFWRFFIASLWISIFVLKNELSKNIASVDNRILLFVFFLGALGYAGSSAFYFMASQYIGTGLAMVIFFSYPLLVALVSWLIHRHKLTFTTLLALVIMVIGLTLLQQASSHRYSLIGIIFAIISAICYVFYVVNSKRFSSIAMDSNKLTMAVCLGSALIFLLLALSKHQFVLPHSPKTWVWLLSLAILATAVPIQLMLEGLKHVSSFRASIISVLEPLVTLLIGIILLNEAVTHLQLIGGMLILGSALMIQFQGESS